MPKELEFGHGCLKAMDLNTHLDPIDKSDRIMSPGQLYDGTKIIKVQTMGDPFVFFDADALNAWLTQLLWQQDEAQRQKRIERDTTNTAFFQQ